MQSKASAPPDLNAQPEQSCAERLHAPEIAAAATPQPTPRRTHSKLASLLDARFKIEQPVNLHVTGCPHSCAQHYVGDIGLMGTKVGGAEGYQVLIGGGSDADQGLARELISSVAYSELPPMLESLFGVYMERRKPEESFLDFSRRHSIPELQSFLSMEATVAR